MLTHRMFSLAALAVVILIVSCAAPVVPTTVPTQPAPQVASPTQAAAATLPPTPTTAQTAVPTKAAATLPPTPTTAQTAVPTKAAAQPSVTSGAPAKLDMDAIFPPGPGREVMLENCTTCHTFVPMVVLQYTQSQWDLSAKNHRDRVPRMGDSDFKAAYDYLAKNFNPDHPVPVLPKYLLDTWTDY